MVDIGQTMFAYTVFLAALKSAEGGRMSPKAMLANMLTNKAFIGMALGIVLGGSGNGEQIAANKVKGARCALAWSVETAKLAREHNNAQLIGLGGRMHSEEEALAIVDAFVAQPWSEEERHQRRIDILAEYEKTGIAPALPEQE